MEVIQTKFKPFNIVKCEGEKTYKLVVGTYQVTKTEFTTVKEAEKYLKEQPYEICLSLISICLDYEKNHQKQNA